jgi:hypothetical protein
MSVDAPDFAKVGFDVPIGLTCGDEVTGAHAASDTLRGARERAEFTYSRARMIRRSASGMSPAIEVEMLAMAQIQLL